MFGIIRFLVSTIGFFLIIHHTNLWVGLGVALVIVARAIGEDLE